MTNKINNKQNKTSIALFLSLAIAAVMLINAAIITANASNNNFSATPENDNNIVNLLPTPTPKAKKRGTTSEKATQTPQKPGVLISTRKATEGTTPETVPTSEESKSIPKNTQRGQSQKSATSGTSSGLGGAYTATTTGVSGGVATGGATGMGRGGKGGQSGGQGAGTKLQIQINKFISDTQVDQLETASGNGELAQALSDMNCGTVVIGGKSITINAAIAVQGSNGGVIYLLSAQTFSTQGENGSGAAGAVGFIEMRMTGNAGKGSMYTTTQVAVTNGSVAARGGASTATQLTIQKSGSGAKTSQTTERTTTPSNPNGESYHYGLPAPSTRSSNPSTERAGSDDEVNCILNCQKIYEIAFTKCDMGPAFKQQKCIDQARKVLDKCTGSCSDN